MSQHSMHALACTQENIFEINIPITRYNLTICIAHWYVLSIPVQLDILSFTPQSVVPRPAAPASSESQKYRIRSPHRDDLHFNKVLEQ